ncbi:PaaX family transcriptional regulator C-terminal domain-containing protein [uncultured Roseobacter sp.]|uniref:PaaX family transcriptional regulator C-terminal domain-containing protein n=1 Tax=uncultured Roseobacter sp. TaxID=114847 RepID=UPI0026027E41|nr:PaaX family transcriptional regulator C-terminal domain-containing protein [uncultured Roseobacter sp.]
MLSDPLDHLTTALTDLGGQRVWSLLVTVFGDLVPDAGAGIDGPVLSTLMGRMNVRAEATRVALHRLRNDGWITSAKSGRTSRHSLTEHGRRETIQASRRIYAAPDDMPGGWVVLLTEKANGDPRNLLETAGFTQMMPRVYIGPAGRAVPENTLALSGDAVPDWLRRQLTPETLCADYSKLHGILTEIDSALPNGADLSPVDCAVLRCLIVHNWRRLVLKHPDLPAALYTEDWREQECRALVTALLHRFPRPDLADLAT